MRRRSSVATTVAAARTASFAERAAHGRFTGTTARTRSVALRGLPSCARRPWRSLHACGTLATTSSDSAARTDV